jgi:hypothetical protein
MAMAEFAIAETNSPWSTVDEKRLANVRERNDYFLRNIRTSPVSIGSSK